MDIDSFLLPITTDLQEKMKGLSENTIYRKSKIFSDESSFPDLSDCDLAIIGINEDRGSKNNKGCASAPDFVREKLLLLACGNYSPKICDLGNIRSGNELKDTYAAISIVCGELLKQGIIPVLIGGSHDLTYAQYLSYKVLEQSVNIVTVDAFFDLGSSGEKEFNSNNFVGKIILHQPNFLFNLSNIGFQTHFVGQESIQLMDKLFFDAYRLGQVRKNIEEVEPIVRNADFMSFDISSVRSADAPGNRRASPNGFFGEEVCQIARYAGLSDKLTSVGFYETNPELDQHEQSSYLVAEMIWYFVDGFYNRKKENPLTQKNAFKKYNVEIKRNDQEIIFYKSKKSERWWMEVPYPDSKEEHKHHHIIPCSYSDYQTACREEIPDRWWLAFQKFCG